MSQALNVVINVITNLCTIFIYDYTLIITLIAGEHDLVLLNILASHCGFKNVRYIPGTPTTASTLYQATFLASVMVNKKG